MLKSTFNLGGIHPPENKKYSEGQKIVPVSAPDQISINVNQHIGKKAKPVIEKKQEVSAGDVIGEADGFISAFVHSPVSGTVKKIDRVLTAAGVPETTIIIDVDHEKTAEDLKKFETIQDIDVKKITGKQILKKIQDAGIVGQGGATFPMHVKLSPPPDRNIDTLILNGAECEPYLTADHQLMLEKSDELLKGTKLLEKVLKVKNIFIGIEENKPDAISLLEKKIIENDYKNFSVVPLKTKYPQGGEKQLIMAITKREIPSGKLPFDVGVVVQNVGTVFSVYEAVYYNKPLMERVTTITGFVKKPGNFMIKMGTPFAYAIDEGAGGIIDPERVRSVINGGPMMGKTVRQLDVSIMKGTSGIVVLSDGEFSFDEEGPCIRCGRCIDICPMGLMPVSLADDTIIRNAPNLTDTMDCIECGSCSYVCPTSRQLVHWIRIGKTVFRNWKTQEEKYTKDI